MPGAVVAQLEIDDVGGAQLRVPHERRLCRALARLHENRDADAQGHLQALKPRRWRRRDLLEKQPIADFFLSIGRTPTLMICSRSGWMVAIGGLTRISSVWFRMSLPSC